MLLGRYRSVALVLLLDLVLTAVFFNIVGNQHEARTAAEFERQANSYVAAIQKGIERNLEVIESIGGLYAASDKVERDEFRKFVRGPLSRHQEIQALSWNERVAHSERRQFEDSVRREGYPEFQFEDLDPDGRMVVAIERPEYIVVTYIEPYESNHTAMGLDVASNPTRLAALERARDTGEMITTARITLVQETGNQYGFLILKPIYKNPAAPGTVEERRQALKGFAVGTFRAGDMVEAALEDLTGAIVNVQLVDEASPADESLLYLGQASDGDNAANQEQLKARGKIYFRGQLEIPGRQWSLLITPTSEFLGGQASWEAWGVLAGGLLIAALLKAYLITVINHGAKTQRLAAELTMANEGLKTEIIEREQAEEALSNLNEELEQRVAERTQELSKANIQLHAANEELEAFSYSVSHDLRAPLRAVDGFSSILLEEYAPNLSGEPQQYLRQVRDNVQQMGSLIDDLLAFSRLSRQPLKKQTLAPAVIASEALADLRSEQEGRSIEISIGELPDCHADPALLKQVFVNLIGNSLKYTRGRERAVIEIGCLPHPFVPSPDGREAGGEDNIYFVKDSGVGFDMRYVDKLFGVFQRLHRAEEYEGTGVGLAIVQRIIHRHGGRIWAEAEVNKGAEFYFTLGGEPTDVPNG